MLLAFILLVLLATAVATAVICLLHGSTFAELFRRPPWRLGTMVTGVPAVAAGVILRLATDRWDAAIAGATLAALPLLVWFRNQRRSAARVAKLDAQAIADIVADLRRRRPAPGSRSLVYDVAVTSAANQFFAVGRLDACAEVLHLLDWDNLDAPILVEAATRLAACLLISGHTEEARKTFELGRQHMEEHGDRDVSAVLDARILVHEGKLKKASKQLPDLEQIANRRPDLRVDTLVIRIHAVAGRGDHDEAVALIGTLGKEHGAEAISLLKRPEGPATPIAAELATRSAYR